MKNYLTFTLFLHSVWNFKQRIVFWLGGKTLGARALVIKEDEVLLVRHTYNEGWYTVGGTVDAGETPVKTIMRELLEEVGVTVEEEPLFMGIYHSDFLKRDDYVILYVVKLFSQVETVSPEIAELKWFKLNELPSDVSPATLRRIQEYLCEIPISENW